MRRSLSPRNLYSLPTAGKTLQTISLIWTLLKQSPHAGKPTIDKCIIACPSSLVRNWANELDKWLGKGAVGVFALDGRSSKAETITNLRRWIDAKGRNVTLPVMIVSYETLRTLTAELANCEIGLLVCDEGHRLKNGESLTFTTLTSLKVQRRVILSGTPIQNDLSEYFSLLNFANPDFLGSKADFRKNFENAIIRGRDADATDAVKEESEKKLKELGGLVAPFIIRRTNELLSKYRKPLRFWYTLFYISSSPLVPVKYEHVVFCALSPFQTALYRLFISSPEIQKLLRGKGSQPLKAIGLLKKLCNHPDLLDLPGDLPGSEEILPPGYVGGSAAETTRASRALGGRSGPAGVDCTLGGKFMVLERYVPIVGCVLHFSVDRKVHRMLDFIKTRTNDKIVLISNYTQTLDLMERLCRAKQYVLFYLQSFRFPHLVPDMVSSVWMAQWGSPSDRNSSTTSMIQRAKNSSSCSVVRPADVESTLLELTG